MGIGGHADKVTQKTLTGESGNLTTNAILIVEIPPCRPQLQLGGEGTVLKTTEDNGKHLKIARIEIVYNGATQQTALEHPVEITAHNGSYIAVIETVKTAMMTQKLEHSGIDIGLHTYMILL